jgi:apolipoprotein N-acyltransferase
MKNGVPQWIVTALLAVLVGIIGWNYRGLASDVDDNTTDRVLREGAQQAQTIVWLENAVREIHHEQGNDRDLLNRIAKELKVEEAPAIGALPKKEAPKQ